MGEQPDHHIEEMVVTRKLRRIDSPSPRFQHERLVYAAGAINLAAGAVDDSPAVAFSNAYDGMRHCVDAHLNSEGLRAESGDGGHRHRVEYARSAMSSILTAEDLDYYRAARSIRNQVEYPEPARGEHMSPATARQAVAVARRFHKAVRDVLEPPGSSRRR